MVWLLVSIQLSFFLSFFFKFLSLSGWLLFDMGISDKSIIFSYFISTRSWNVRIFSPSIHKTPSQIILFLDKHQGRVVSLKARINPTVVLEIFLTTAKCCMVALHCNMCIFVTKEAFITEMFEIIHINCWAASVPHLVEALKIIKQSQKWGVHYWNGP